MKLSLQTLVALAGASLLAGCGGGSGAVADIEAGARDFNYGPVSTRAVGGPQVPVVMASSSSVVTGVYGASFLNVSVNLVPSSGLSALQQEFESPIAMSVLGKPALYNLNGDPTGPTGVHPLPSLPNDVHPSFSANGQIVLTSEYVSGIRQIFSTYLDGSSRTQLTNAGADSLWPSWNPVTGQICFARSNEIFIMNSNGTGQTNLTNDGNGALGTNQSRPKFNPSGTKIGYIQDGATEEFYDMNTNGTGKAIRFVSAGVTGWDYGTLDNIVAWTRISGNREIVLTNLVGGTEQVLESTNSVNTFYTECTVSPSGLFIATRRTLNGVSNLMLINTVTAEKVNYLTMPTNWFVGDWAVWPRKKFMINATSAVLHTNAAGFLYGVRGDRFQSLLAFDAQTRNTVAIDNHSASGDPLNFVATITAADKINMLRYVNGYAHPRQTVVDPANVATHIQGAIVTYNAETARINNVVTFSRSRGGANPTKSESNGRLIFQGDFQAIYDSEGKRTAGPSSRVTIEPKSGNVTVG